MKKTIITVIVTAIICITGTSYAAYKLKAEQVSFDNRNIGLNSDNIQSAIDELTTDILSYGDAMPEDINNGKTALVNGKKITGTKVDKLSSVKDKYRVATNVSSNTVNIGIGYNANDILIVPVYIYSSETSDYDYWGSTHTYNMSFNYDSSTGILSLTRSNSSTTEKKSQYSNHTTYFNYDVYVFK